MKDTAQRIDINYMTKEQADELSKQIGDKVIKCQTDALKKINNILKKYGMKAEMAVQILKLKE